MDTAEISKVHERLTLLLATGDDSAAHAYLAEQYPRLPEDIQRQIALATFIDAMKTESQERDEVANIQEQGFKAAQILERAKGLPTEDID